MTQTAAILDCYTVEPSGLGVPPYLSPYVRNAYSAVHAALPGTSVKYVTIDDVRWCLNGGEPRVPMPLSDPLTYSATVNRLEAIKVLADASIVVVIAGDAVPSVHLQAQNGSIDEITRALACVRGRRILLGPLVTEVLMHPETYCGLFDALHSHTITSRDFLSGSRSAAPYSQLTTDRDSYPDLIDQLRWRPIAEIELYRGCTRRSFCSFCNEPIKSATVAFRDVDDVVDEVGRLYHAGVRNFRLGQQTCFFSYQRRDYAQIERLLAGIRDACPELEVLHIDNADPLAVASPVGARIAGLVAQYCTEGNCAPMGIESFDPVVIDKNALTCTPEILLRALDHINQVGSRVGPLGLPLLLPGLNLVYGLPGETHNTHFANLTWLGRILHEGLQCHRTNVRQARAYPGTPLERMQMSHPPPSNVHYASWKADVDHVYDQPMKERVYPIGRRIHGLHSFFVTSRGTWYRRLGSYSLQIIEAGASRALYEPAQLTVTAHAARHVYGKRVDHEHAVDAA